MAKKRYSELLNERIKIQKEKNTSIKEKSTTSYSSELNKRILSKSFDIDTFESDLSTISDTIKSVYSGWQTKETMKNTLSSVQSMYDRVGKYQEYQKQYGGTDLSDLQKTLKGVIDDWDNLSEKYRGYNSKEAYDKAVKASADNKKKLESYDTKAGSKKISSLEEVLKTAKGYAGNISSLKGAQDNMSKRSYGMVKDSYSTKITSAEKELDKYLKSYGYSSIEDLEKALGEEKLLKTNATRYQENLKLGSVGDVNSQYYDKDYEKYVAEGKKIPYTEVGTEDKKRVSYGKGRPVTKTTKSDTRMAAEALSNFLNGNTKRDEASPMNYYKDEEIFSLMTEKEFNDLAYYMAKDKEDGGDRTSKYVESIKETLNYRRGKEISDSLEGKTFSQLAFGVDAGLDQFASGMKNLASDKDYIPTSHIQYASGEVREDLYHDDGWLARTGYDLINTTSNMLPSILTSSVVGVMNPVAGSVVGAGLLGASASGNAYQEMLNLGYDKGQAKTYAALVGISEAGLQYALGGIGKLGGVSGKIAKAVDAVDNALAKVAIRIGGSMLSEGFEEAVQEVLNPIFTNIAAGYDTGAEVDWGEVAYSGLLGALSGGLMEGPSVVANTYAEYSNNKQIGQNIRDNAKVQDVFDIASASPEASLAYEAYTRYANKGISAENVKDAQLGSLWQNARTDKENIAHDKNSTTSETLFAKDDYHKLGDMAKFNPEARVKEAFEKKANKRTYNDSDSVKTLVKSGLESAEGTEAHRLATEYNAKLDTGKKLTDNEINKLVKANQEAVKTEHTSEIASRLTELGATKDVDKMADIIARKSLGETITGVELDAVKSNEVAKQVLYENTNEELSSYAETMDKEDADLFFRMYDGKTDVDAYANAFNLMQTYANMPESISEEVALASRSVLTPTQAAEIYGQSIKISSQRMQKANAEIRARISQGERGIIEDSIVNLGNNFVPGKVNWSNLAEDQKFGYTFTRGLYTALGSNLAFVGKNNKFNGAYDISKDITYIDLYAGKSVKDWTGKNLIIPTVSHELTHEMEVKSPELFKTMSKIVLDGLEKSTGKTRNELISEEIDRLDKKHPEEGEHTEKDAISEIVARACEDLLAESQEAKRMFKSLSPDEQKTLVEKIKSLIQKVIDWIDDFLASQKYKSNSEEAKALRKMKEEFGAMSILWDKMLLDVQKFNQEVANGEVSNDTTTENKMQLSIREEFSSEIDAWQKDGMPNGETFILGTTGDVLQGLGAIESDIYMLSKKINEILKDHPEMTIDEIKKIPQILENPILILASKNVGREDADNTRLVIFGNIKAKDGRPILSVLDLKPVENNLTISDMQKVSSAYTKDVKPVDFIRDSLVVYADKKRTTKLLRTIGFKAPIELQLSGYIGRISYPGQNVNIEGEEFSKVFKESENFRFSMRENVEETRELVAVHNMQVSELERTLDLGGLPMPSIAIIKAQRGHSEYGDVSLVFPKSTIDPKTDRNNKVYGGDAWTPVYPKIEYKPNAKVTKKINDKYYELSRKFGYDESRPLYNYVYDMEDILNRHNGEAEMIADLYEDQGMMQLYLLDSGKNKVETIQKETRTELTDAEVEMNEFFIKELGENVVDEIVWNGEGTPMAHRKNYLSKYEDAIREAYKKLLLEEYHFTDEQAQNVMDSTKNADFIKFMRDAHKYRENGRVTTKTEADYEATKEAIKTAAGEEYRKWVDSLFKGIEEKSGIRNNTDFFTNSGNRRSWEALHWENNLENVVKIMKSQDNGVAAFFSGQAIWGVSAKDYRSIEEIKADADRLKQLPEEEYNKIKEGFGERLSEIARCIMDKSESNPFIAVDNAMECIVDALRHSKTKSGVMSYLKQFTHLTVTETNVEDIISLVTDISNMPTEYFEAKPRRAVELNEIATAIIPTNTSPETKARLDDMGIKYLEYESGNENARLDALNSLENLKFSDRDSEGNTLSEGQIEYFKDSKVRDENGNLLVVYHGTRKADFTEFKRNVNFFTDSKEMADSYSPNREMYKGYLNITKPYEIDASGEKWSKIPIDEATKQFLQEYGASVFKEGGKWRTTPADIASAIEEAVDNGDLDYDGIVIKNIDDTGSYYKGKEKHLGTDYIAFNSNQFKNTDNTNPTKDKDIRYADREDTTVYDLMGETERIVKENEKFKADIERLNERLKIERQVTHGNYFNENQLGAVAGHLRNIARSNMDKVELMKALKGVYSFIAQTENLTWEDVFERSYNLASEMLKESKPVTMVDDYSKQILREIRNTKISLNESQKAEAKNRFGNNWNRFFFGKVTITDNATPIESMWQQWANQYPGTFDAETNPMDMAEELYNILGSLKDSSEIIETYNNEETTRWLANEIYNQYWNVSPIRTTADKYDKQIKRLNYEHRQSMAEMRAEYNSRLESQKLADTIHYKKQIAELSRKLRENRDRDVAKAKELGRQRLDSFKENAERKTRIQSITATTLSLNDMYIKNSKDKHIPEIMKEPVANIIKALNFSSKRLLEKGIPTKRDISLKDALKDIQTMMMSDGSAVDGAIELYGTGLSEDIEKMLKNVDIIAKKFGDNELILQTMSLDDLHTLDATMKVIRASVNKLNKFHVTQHNAGVEALGVETSSDVESAKKIYKDHKKHFDKMKTKLYWNQLNPYYAFKNLGKSAQKVFKAFMDGQDKMAFLAKKVIDFAESVYNDKEYNKWNETFFDFEIKQPDGSVKEFTMNVPQIMSLYCLSKQDDAKRHLLHGKQAGKDDEVGKGRGITLVETDKTRAVSKNILLTEADLNEIIAKLDEVDRAKEVADKLQEYMATEGAKLGNEISMARWGIKSFGIENYFPIKVSDGAVPDKGDTPGVQGNPLVALLNMSFTHSRNHFAPQSIEIGNVFDVFANHMSSMIQYNAMALPVLDMYKWMNTKVTDNYGNEISVKTSIKDTFGDHAWGYFNTFLKDVNGSTKGDTRDNLGVKFFKNAKVAKVAANIRVTLLQFTSYIRAGAVMDNKYLLRALAHKPKIAKSTDNCGMVLWKSFGYYETDITRPLTDKIKHTVNVKDKIVDWSLKGAEVADKVTLGVLWNACELEVRDTRKDLTPGTKEFDNEVGLRLREVIYRTQVVDSQLTRSQMMRSKGGWDKVLTTFASESTLSFNLITDLFVSYKLDSRRMGKEVAKQKHGKYMRKAITAYVVTNVVTSMLATMFDAFRDYDEEEKDEAYLLRLMLENLATNSSFINKIPYINQFTSIISGFTPSRVETDWMKNASDAIKEIFKLLVGEGSGEKAFEKTLRALSDGTGIAGYNLYRDVRAFIELFN